MTLRMKTKVQLILVLSLAFIVLVGLAGLVATSSVGRAVDEFAGEKVPNLQALSQLSTAAGRAVSAASAVENGTLDEKSHAAAMSLVDAQLRIAATAAGELERLARERAETRVRLAQSIEAWRKDFEKLAAAAGQRTAAGDNFAQVAGAQSLVTAQFEAVRQDGQKLLEDIDAEAAATRASAATLADRASASRRMAWWGGLLALLIAAAVLIAAGGLLVRSVNRSLRGLQVQARALEEAVHDGRLEARASVEGLDDEFRPVVLGMNATMDAFHTPITLLIDHLTRISQGDIPPPIAEPYRGRFADIREAFNRCIRSLTGLVAGMARMTDEQEKGDLDAFMEEKGFEGAYLTMAGGVNRAVRMHIDNLKGVLEVVGAYSGGDFEPVLRQLPGKQAVINEKLDLLRSNLRSVTGEIAALIAAALAGTLSTRADADRFSGEWQGIVEGLNQMLEAVVGPLQAAARAVEQIGRGEIPERIATSWNGDFGTLRDNLNRCIDAVNALARDTSELAGAAVAGDLSRRADVRSHQGDFARIVEGVNRTLDTLIAPFSEAARVLEHLAHRELAARMEGEYRGDHARLKESVNSMADALQQALTQVASAVEQVSGAAAQIASSSQAVASGASEQAASFQETRSSLKGVADMSERASANAQQASELATSARTAAADGAAAVDKLQGTMQKIRNSAEGTGQIIKDVSEIAFQTNLLALNAAVEAARAGEAGRGFAVVAEEVRSLALRAKEAAVKTEELIRESVGQAAEGQAAAGHVADGLGHIVGSVSKVTDIVLEIAATAREQARGVDQVNRSVTEMDRVTQQNAASAEESSAAAGELSSQAEELAAMVGSFRLEQRALRPAQPRRRAAVTAL